MADLRAVWGPQGKLEDIDWKAEAWAVCLPEKQLSLLKMSWSLWRPMGFFYLSVGL